MSDKVVDQDSEDVFAAIQSACTQQVGVLDSHFLCQSVSVLNPKVPICVSEGATLGEVFSKLRDNRVGCVVVTNEAGEVTGIFSERDCVLKILGTEVDTQSARVAEFMTPNPVCESPATTLAYALNLMSHGGFRHLPLVDQDRLPIGIVSVKDIVDCLVGRMTDALMDFEVEEE